jgi:LuxR family maltose regulon positive regulatory protein
MAMIEPGMLNSQDKISFTANRLLMTKLHITRSRSSLVTRHRLVNRLTEGLAHKLILISAPPGFGKTAILCDWISQSSYSFSWLSLDVKDNESARYWGYYIAAIQRLNPKLGNQALAWLQTSPSIPTEVFLTTLLNEIDSFSEPFAIVLEDYHTIDSQQIHQNLLFLIDHRPVNIHLIITSWSDPQLPLAQYRPKNEMVEILSEGLRFNSEETDLFLNQTMELNLTFEQIARLEARTEGWIAVLQLAALSMRGHHDKSGFIISFTGSNRYILDYLIEQVLQRQTTEIQGFLLHTSILHRFTATLCDAVTGRNDSQIILENLDNANWFNELDVSTKTKGEPLIHSPVSHQIELYGILNKLRDLGLTLISVRRIRENG